MVISFKPILKAITSEKTKNDYDSQADVFFFLALTLEDFKQLKNLKVETGDYAIVLFKKNLWFSSIFITLHCTLKNLIKPRICTLFAMEILNKNQR